MQEWLSERNEALIFAFVWLLLMAAAEGGLRIARRTSAGGVAPQVSSIQSAALGLLALLLGFTFAMAAGRFQARRDLVLEEANAIGTAYLRAQLLSEPERGNTARLLQRYLNTRFALHQRGFARDARQQTDAQASQLHAQLWRELEHAVARDRSPITALVASALNEVIDLHGKQMASLRNGIPGPIVLLLLLVAVLSLGVTGYASGPSYRQSAALNFLISLMVAAVILLIVDLHRPSRGLIRVDLASMRDLARGMRPTP